METQTARNMNRLIPLMLGVICVVLIIIVLLQYRYNTELKKELNEITLSERIQPELKATDLPSAVNNTPDKKIKKLESQIADMQDWQDYLEKSLKKYQTEEDKKEDLIYRETRDGYSRYIKGFAEENDLPSEIRVELINLLTERSLELRNLLPGNPERDRIKQKYDALISELLSDKYTAYTDYQKVDNERNYVRDFRRNIMTLNNQLDKQQEKSLITAIYNDKQVFNESIKEEIQPLNGKEEVTIEKLKEIVALQKKLHNSYLDSAKNILSESQFKEFQKYLDAKISSMEAENEKYEAVVQLQEELANRDGN